MTITTINYSQSKETVYSYGLKKWVKVGLDIAIDEKDDTQKVFEFAKETVENWLKEEVQQDAAQMQEEVIQVENKPNPIDPILDEISKCTTIDELNKCWLMSKGNLTLSSAYKEKEKQLKDAK